MKEFYEFFLLSEKAPPLSTEILLYKVKPMGGYYEGYYIGSYEIRSSNEGPKEFIIIKDMETNNNNIRDLKEFKYWALLPKLPL